MKDDKFLSPAIKRGLCEELSRIPVVNKSMRLSCQAVMSVHHRQLRGSRVVQNALDHVSRKTKPFDNSRIARIRHHFHPNLQN